jgi:hypothetical protein
LASGQIVANDYDLFRLRKRQRTQNNCIHDAEDCGVSANAKRKGDDCYRREAGLLQEHAETVPEVLDKVCHKITNFQLLDSLEGADLSALWSKR